jgi:hypothetical protein
MLLFLLFSLILDFRVFISIWYGIFRNSRNSKEIWSDGHGETVTSVGSFGRGRCYPPRFVGEAICVADWKTAWVAVDSVECATCIPGCAALYMLDSSLCGFIVVCVCSFHLNPSRPSLHLVLHLEVPLVPELRGTEWRRRCRTAQSQHCLRLGRQA